MKAAGEYQRERSADANCDRFAAYLGAYHHSLAERNPKHLMVKAPSRETRSTNLHFGFRRAYFKLRLVLGQRQVHELCLPLSELLTSFDVRTEYFTFTAANDLSKC